MPKANALSTTPRRSLFSGVIAASILTATASGAFAQTLQDSQLLELCQQYWRLDAALNALEWETTGETGAEEAAIEQRISNLADERYTIITQIKDSPAKTAQGRAAKAKVAHSLLPPAVEAYNLTNESEEICLVMSLMQDVMEGAAV
ncbi:MAG: hypothetical protein ABF628_00720 [Acetobacter orientalis]|uniref:hypothetical protein n=1 Tax=Acetobacter orientalis TaxID=146474 RepID=UPI0039ED094B